MGRGYHKGDITLEQLEAKFDEFSKRMPGITKESLERIVKMLREEMRLRYSVSGLQRRSGDLFQAIGVLNVQRKGSQVNAGVGIGTVTKGPMAKNRSQVYKAVAHELGMRVGKGVTLPKRAFVEPTRKAKLEQAKNMLLQDLVRGYEDTYV